MDGMDEREVQAQQDRGLCEDCGVRPVEYEGPCPYDAEINDTVTEIAVCDDCYGNRADDI